MITRTPRPLTPRIRFRSCAWTPRRLGMLICCPCLLEWMASSGLQKPMSQSGHGPHDDDDRRFLQLTRYNADVNVRYERIRTAASHLIKFSECPTRCNRSLCMCLPACACAVLCLLIWHQFRSVACVSTPMVNAIGD